MRCTYREGSCNLSWSGYTIVCRLILWGMWWRIVWRICSSILWLWLKKLGIGFRYRLFWKLVPRKSKILWRIISCWASSLLIKSDLYDDYTSYIGDRREGRDGLVSHVEKYFFVYIIIIIGWRGTKRLCLILVWSWIWKIIRRVWGSGLTIEKEITPNKHFLDILVNIFTLSSLVSTVTTKVPLHRLSNCQLG